MNTEEMTARSLNVAVQMQSMLTEVFGDVAQEEGGDGDSWYVAAVHTPNMPEGGVMTFSSLPYAESIGAATLLSFAFSQKCQQRELSFVERGFSDLDARRLSMVEAYRRHYDADSLPGRVIELIDQFDALEASVERIEIRQQIEAILTEIQEEADADVAAKAEAAQQLATGLAMSNPQNWGQGG